MLVTLRPLTWICIILMTDLLTVFFKASADLYYDDVLVYSAYSCGCGF